MVGHGGDILDQGGDETCPWTECEVHFACISMKVKAVVNEKDAILTIHVASPDPVKPENQGRIIDLVNRINNELSGIGGYSFSKESNRVVSKAAIPIPNGYFDMEQLTQTFRMMVQHMGSLSGLIECAAESNTALETLIDDFKRELSAAKASEDKTH